MELTWNLLGIATTNQAVRRTGYHAKSAVKVLTSLDEFHGLGEVHGIEAIQNPQRTQRTVRKPAAIKLGNFRVVEAPFP